MPREIVATKGKCLGCNEKECTAKVLGNHLKTCHGLSRLLQSENPSEGFLVRVCSKPLPKRFWLYVAVPLGLTLKELNDFLEEIWLDCGCGHLSCFETDTAEIDSRYQENFTVEEVFKVGDRIHYQYDFGSSTDLNLFVEGALNFCPSDQVTLIARNNQPECICNECKQDPAEYIYHYEDYAELCKKCTMARFEDLDEEEKDEQQTYWYQIVNSPRCGECGYAQGVDF